MSYVVNVYRIPDGEPLPGSFDEAIELTEGLFDQRANANWRFRRFVSKLTRRYPDITSVEAQELPQDDLAWTDGPLDGDTNEAVYNLGLNIERLEEVRPFVIEAARNCGLGVRDDQAGEIHLPFNLAFSPRGQLAPASLPAREPGMPDRHELIELLSERLLPVLGRHNFRRSTMPDDLYTYDVTRFFRQDFPLGFHLLRLRAYVGDDLTKFELVVESQFSPVTSQLMRILNGDTFRGSIASSTTTWLQQDAWLPDPKGLTPGEYGAYVVSSRDAISRALDHLVMSFEKVLVPVLHRYQTLEGFESLMNPTWRSMFFGGYHEHNLAALVSAHMARNPDLPRIVDEYEQAGAWQRKQRNAKLFPQAFETLDKVVSWMRDRDAGRNR